MGEGFRWSMPREEALEEMVEEEEEEGEMEEEAEHLNAQNIDSLWRTYPQEHPGKI